MIRALYVKDNLQHLSMKKKILGVIVGGLLPYILPGHGFPETRHAH
jgi:hypothetical protein